MKRSDGNLCSKEKIHFDVDLVAGKRGFSPSDLEKLIAVLPVKPHRIHIPAKSGGLAGRVSFTERSDAEEAAVDVWKSRLRGEHMLTPVIFPEVCKEGLDSRVRALFLGYMNDIRDGEEVQRCRIRIEEVELEVRKLRASTRLIKLKEFHKTTDQITVLKEEQRLMEKRIDEFREAVLNLMMFLQGGNWPDGVEDGDFEVFWMENRSDWDRIHHVILRECKRLSDGLPIYAYRREILHSLEMSQDRVMVLIGETGSGKSTQCIQYLADSYLSKRGSILCTQPRKIAAASLAQRVGQESSGCYKENSVVCYPSFSSAQDFKSKVIYMTDSCLLQHCMNNLKLANVSCIVVDEAHERSLNTDLLLGLLKKILPQENHLRLIIMSATADASKLSRYFFGCDTFLVRGRTFPVEVKYVTSVNYGSFSENDLDKSPHASDVITMVSEIHKKEPKGDILAFLTSQAEVEWACEKFLNQSGISLALHGKLSSEEQQRVFNNYPGKRKVIFATNLAETSLTIPGVKYVVDSGLAKESKFDPSTGMNVLKVRMISQSSANQRAGRAGRTEAGTCYRLYSENEYLSMSTHQEPEIKKVHLGIAVLKIVSMGISNIHDFDFIDSPSRKAIELAVRNLVHLGAVTLKGEDLILTSCGRYINKLGIEPRLGKLILSSFEHGLSREGVVLAAVMANASSIFCRGCTFEEKEKSDCIKMQFCHPDGDLFTLLAVYKEWEEKVLAQKNKWCWQNRINAKTMRRCTDTVIELENCLKQEAKIMIPKYWVWQPNRRDNSVEKLKTIMLSSLAENVAMFTGYDRYGYEVALTGQQALLHPGSSLLVFAHKPSWVVFSEVLSTSKEYLVCATAIEPECISKMEPPPLFDFNYLTSRKLVKKSIFGNGVGNNLLRRFCGKFMHNLHSLTAQMQNACNDSRVSVDIDFRKRELTIYASAEQMEKAYHIVNEALEFEKKLMQQECIEKQLFVGLNGSESSSALFGPGAVIKHLELGKKFLSVDVSHEKAKTLDDKELLMLFDKYACGIGSFQRYAGHGLEKHDSEKWGRITFLCPDAAETAVEKLNDFSLHGFPLKLSPLKPTMRLNPKMLSFPAVKAKVTWPRRMSKGVALIHCEPYDAEIISRECGTLEIGANIAHCQISTKFPNCAVIFGLDRSVSEAEIWRAVRQKTTRKILDLNLLRDAAVHEPPANVCTEALLKEIAEFVTRDKCLVYMYSSEPKDHLTKAMINFDGNLHLRAAMALDHLNGRVLSCCLPWQRIKCEHMFHSIVSCPGRVHFVIKKQLDLLIGRMKSERDVMFNVERAESGSFKVKISSTALQKVSRCRTALENLMKGKTITSPDLKPGVLQLLHTRDGFFILKSVEKETGTFFLFDKQSMSVRAFGAPDAVAVAEKKFITSIVALHRKQGNEIHLSSEDLPLNLMREVVRRFGHDLSGLQKLVPEAGLKLVVRRHVLMVDGNDEQKRKVEAAVAEVVRSLSCGTASVSTQETTCSICLCEVEDGYRLEACGHEFCRTCLVEQCEAAIRSNDGFPIQCTHQGCETSILQVDFRALLSDTQLEHLFRASLTAFVSTSGGAYKFCPTPDCPSVYRVADPESPDGLFVCGACSAETCTKCHLEHHPYVTCEQYKRFKDDPDTSLKEWRQGKIDVKNCPACGFTIEKADGCNHMHCRCGKHICWMCMEMFETSRECYDHLGLVHDGMV